MKESYVHQLIAEGTWKLVDESTTPPAQPGDVYTDDTDARYTLISRDYDLQKKMFWRITRRDGSPVVETFVSADSILCARLASGEWRPAPKYDPRVGEVYNATSGKRFELLVDTTDGYGLPMWTVRSSMNSDFPGSLAQNMTKHSVKDMIKNGTWRLAKASTETEPEIGQVYSTSTGDIVFDTKCLDKTYAGGGYCTVRRVADSTRSRISFRSVEDRIKSGAWRLSSPAVRKPARESSKKTSDTATTAATGDPSYRCPRCRALGTLVDSVKVKDKLECLTCHEKIPRDERVAVQSSGTSPDPYVEARRAWGRTSPHPHAGLPVGGLPDRASMTSCIPQKFSRYDALAREKLTANIALRAVPGHVGLSVDRKTATKKAFSVEQDITKHFTTRDS